MYCQSIIITLTPLSINEINPMEYSCPQLEREGEVPEGNNSKRVARYPHYSGSYGDTRTVQINIKQKLAIDRLHGCGCPK